MHRPSFRQGQWDKLLQVLDPGRIDLVVQRLRVDRAARARLPGDPALLRLSAAADGSPRQPDPDAGPTSSSPSPGGGRWTVGVLVGSAADTFAAEQGGPHVEVVRFDGATDAMTAVQNGQYDATLQDLPAARFYRDRFPGLELVGPPESHGYYVIYVRDQRPGAARRARPGPGPADRLGRAAAALREIRDLDRRPERAGRRSLARSQSLPGAPADGGWALLAPVSVAAARRRLRHDRPFGHLDAAGHGAGARDRRRPALRSAAACRCCSGLRRADPRHAADAPALRALLPAQAATLGRGNRRAGDQLLGLRGRDLPRRAAGDSAGPDGSRPGPGDVARRWPCGG